jgi:hypothetical protein
MKNSKNPIDITAKIVEKEIIQDLVNVNEITGDREAIMDVLNPDGVLDNPLKEELPVKDLLKD